MRVFRQGKGAPLGVVLLLLIAASGACARQWGKFWDSASNALPTTFVAGFGATPQSAATGINVALAGTPVTGYPLSGPFVIDFTVGIDSTSATVNQTIGSSTCSGSIQVSTNDFASCISLKSVVFSNSAKTLTIAPLPFLLPNTAYKLRLTTALANTSGQTLSTSVTSATITTKDVGKWVFVAGFGGSIFYCTLNQTNGTLGSVNSVAAGGQTQFIALESSGKFVFAQTNNTTPLYYTSINQSTGAIAAPASVTNAASNGLAYHPTLPVLYTTVASQIKPFSINTVSGLPTVGSALAGGTANNIGLVIHPSAKFLYWGQSSASNSVYSAQIASDGNLSGPVSTSTGSATSSWHPAIDPSGNYLYATDYGGVAGLSYLSINQTTGTLTFIGNVAVPLAAQSIAIDPTGRFLYSIGTANPNSTIGVFTLNSSTGAPTLVQTLSGLNSYATFMAIDPSGRFAVVGYGASGVSGDKIISFSINQQTGDLTQVTVLTASNAQSVAIY